jgi:hypothetical protein
LAGFIHAAALAGDTGFVVLFDVARAFEEGAPDLHLLEVDVFPERPARILHVEWACAGQEEDGVLDAGGMGGDVDGQEVEGACCEACEEEAGYEA